MTEPKFTKGPWQRSGVRALSPEYKGHGVGPDGDDYVVVVPYNPKDHFECLANAHLIAAAPELYEALTLAADALSDLLSGDCESPRGYHLEAMNAADAALAKARGEQ